MPIPNKPSYTHGSTGSKPGQSRDYANGDPVDADEFDYYVNEPFETIKDIIDALNNIDSDDDGTVDAADKATNVTGTYKGNDIDSNGDGTVDAADTAAKVKSNDIDSDGDGVVDAADQLKTGGSAAVIRDTNNNSDLLTASEGGPINTPGTDLQERGDRVATRTWATNSNINHSDLGTINSNDHHTRPSAGNAIDDDSNTFNVDPNDDETVHYGATGVSERYDSGNDDIRWQDEGNNTDRMALDRTSGNLNIDGEITEDASI